MPISWTTSFTTPAAPTGLTATPDLGASAIDLAWTATALGSLFWRYYISRVDPFTGDLERIGEVASESDPTFRDQAAPHGPVTYALTVSNGWAESDPINVSTSLPLDWWLVSTADPGLVFELPHVRNYDETWDPQQEAFVPLDAPAPVVVSGELLPPAGSIEFMLLPAERSIFNRLLEAARSPAAVLIKNPFGDIYTVRLGQLRRGRGEAGQSIITLPYTSVA